MRFIPVGQVLVTHVNAPWGAVKLINDLRAASGGKVALRVGDDYPCCGTTLDTVQLQWRTYAWNGAAFTRVGGPTAFGVDTRFPDLALRPTVVTLGAPDAGIRHGELTITVTARGKVAAGRMDLSIGLADAGLVPEGSGWTRFTTGGHSVWRGQMPAPEPGESITLLLGVTRPASQDALTGKVSIMLWPLDELGNLSKDGWNPDNQLDVPVVNAR